MKLCLQFHRKTSKRLKKLKKKRIIVLEVRRSLYFQVIQFMDCSENYILLSGVGVRLISSNLVVSLKMVHG